MGLMCPLAALSVQTNDQYQIELSVLDSNNFNHLRYEEAIAILVCKKLVLTHLKMKLLTNHLNVCKQMTDIK